MEQDDLLYGYFSNSLTPEQELKLESLLKTDTAFAERFNFEKSLTRVIVDKQSNVLKKRLNSYEKEIQSKKETKSLFGYKHYAIAASITILLGWIGYNSLFGINYNSLYNNNFSEYPNTVYTITRGDTKNSLEREAFVAYEAKNYQLVIDKLNAFKAADKKGYVNFYKGQAYLGLENFEKAKFYFEKSIHSNKSFVAESHWYLALIYLKEKDKKAAMSQLKVLTGNFNYNKDKALSVLESLD